MLLLPAAVFAQQGGAKQASLSGNLETKVNAGAGAGASPDFFYGAEEYVNLRLKISVGDHAAVYSAFNVIASAGSYAAAAGSYVYGGNYAFSLEPERLYLQLSSDAFGLNMGLLRVPFGYGLAWGPMDFLNPRNPLKPDARLRAVLGALVSWYPAGDMKFLGFAAAPKDPLALSGGGARAGLGWEDHWSRASLQLLASYESPASYSVSLPVPAQADYPLGLCRFGLSLKGDLELGLVTELLYTLNPDSPEFFPGLSASAGFDYTFLDGKLYVLAEYLYSGSESASASGPANLYGRRNNHYLYGALTWILSDFTSITLGSGACLDDSSALSTIVWKHEPLQGLTISLECSVPLDGESFGGSGTGEFGPVQSGSRFSFTAGAVVKF
jgi:hypothetical protein